MNKFFSFIIRQSVTIILIIIFIIAFGIYGTVNMSINLLPDINVPMVCVQVVYAGASASDVETEVTQNLEDGLGSVGGVNDISSYSYNNLSAVVLSFDYGTDTKDKIADITNKVNSMSLPDGCVSSVYDIDLNSQALAVLSVTGDGTLDEIYQQAERLKGELSSVNGVERVDIKGGGEDVIEVVPFRGAELLTLLLVEAFSYGSLDLPLGSVGMTDGEVQIRNESSPQTMEEIENTAITLPSSFVDIMRTVRQNIPSATYFRTLQTMVEGAAANMSLQTGSQPSDEQLAAYFAQQQGMEPLAKPYVVSFLRSEISDELLSFLFSTDYEVPDEGGMVVSVKDIASVERTKIYSSYAYFYGGKMNLAESIIVEVYKSNGANSAAVVSDVKNTYNSLLKDEDFTASVKLIDDQSEFISDSISNVLTSMIIGGVLAIIVIFVFLKKLKSSLIIAVTMPLSVLAALICLFAMGITLNMVSLGGLAVGIGMLVDNSIVVIEAISKHRDSGKTAYRAAVDGTCEVGGALIGSTITTVCVFIPIIFMTGLTGEIFTDLAWAVIFSLAFSLLIAVTVIPTLYSLFGGGDRQMINPEKVLSSKPVSDGSENETRDKAALHTDEDGKKGKMSGIGERLKTPYVMRGIQKFYKKILPSVISKKIITVCAAAVIFGASVGLVTLTGTEFLPSVDKGQIEVSMSYGASSRIEDIQADVENFCSVIKEEVSGVSYLSASVGKNGLLALTDSGIITVQLDDKSGSDRAVEKIRSLAEAGNENGTVKGTVAVKKIDGVVASLTSGSNDLSVSIMGKDDAVLAKIRDDICERLAKSGFKDISDTLTEKSTQYTYHFDTAKIARYGLDYTTVVMTLRVGIASYTATTLEIEGDKCSLNVRFDQGVFAEEEVTEGEENLTVLEKLSRFIVGFSGDRAVRIRDILTDRALTDFAETYGIEKIEADACIRRSNGYNTVTISARLPGKDTGTASTKMKEIASQVLSSSEYSGYTFENSGISSYLDDAFAGLAVALVISLFLLYAVMAVQFSSFVKPLIVMASIPFSFTGGFLALVITGTSLNVVSFIGLIMLMGVIVNNAIVMLEKIKQLHDGGMAHYDAVTSACSERLRPILMTTLTTILALIPMAVGIGQGSELMQPLGIVVMGGLLLGTLVTLVFIPAVYCLVNRLSAKYPDGKKGVKKTDKDKTAA